MRKFPTTLTAALAVAACATTPAQAVVGGNDAEKGEYTSVAEISFGAFFCTGTLVAPDWVLSAGHCGSLTGAAVASPVSWPAALVDVTIGSHRAGDGETVPVERIVVSPEYLGLGFAHDVSLIKLSRPSTKTPTPIAAVADRAAWEPGDVATIAGWGVTEEGGDQPDVLQEAQVPITTDAYAADAYDDFDPETMVAAGYPEGGVDTCQGDSGGPLFAPTGGGTLRVVGATSFGEGCARPGKPGVYARVADTALRTWIDSVAPQATADDAASGDGTTTTKPGKGNGKGRTTVRG